MFHTLKLFGKNLKYTYTSQGTAVNLSEIEKRKRKTPYWHKVESG